MNMPQSETFHLPGGTARIQWRRCSRARRVSLRIDPSAGDVVVTLPPRAGRGAGVALLMTHADWVTNRLAALPDAVPFTDGAIVSIDGIPTRIRHVPDARGGAWLQDGELHVSGAEEFLRRRTTDFLRTEARRCLAAQATQKAALIERQPRRISVKDTRSRWGSCASDGSISFCWRLIMAPKFVQDYVVAHEVAHLRHMDHGDRFWALVNQLTPHTASAVPWLRTEGSRLLRMG
jgi:predicted metal-dependent hydrolase